MIALLLALPLLVPASPPAPVHLQEPAGQAPVLDAAQPIDASFLADEIDRSVHWLRGQYDPARGTFGSLEADARALLALAECPRQYRVSEGPFVARPLAGLLAALHADGTFGQGLDPALGLRALEALHDPAADQAAARLRAEGVEPLPRAAATADEAATVEGARAALGARHPDGSWGEGAGAVLATAERIGELTRYHDRLKALQAKRGPAQTHPLPAFDPAQGARVDAALARGAAFLLSQAGERGGWGFNGRRDAGITAMVTGALGAVRPRPAEVQKALDAALDYLVSLQKPDGSIHEGQLANYVTSAAVLALSHSGREADGAVVARAREFLERLQADEGEGYSEGDRYYGGVGYGDDERPDLSNLQMALEALNAAGVPSGDAVYQKALVFLQRCQNRSESNDLSLVVDGKTIASGNDGGASYGPGESKAGFIDLPDGTRVPRSYGSMSYALLKGYLFAGLSKDDPRVVSVWHWLSENYTLDVNPGFQASADPSASYQGLFYYFYTMARALDLYGADRVSDASGGSHDWRAELCGRLVAMQRPDGSWVNENSPRWFEGNPVLATAYAMMALGSARPEGR